MSSNLKIDLDSESERLRNEMMNANTLEEVLAIEEKIKLLESKTNKFVESLDNDLVESLDNDFDLNEIKNIETESDDTLTSYKSPLDSENKYYIIKIESGKTTIEYYQNDKKYGRRELLPDNTYKIYQIDNDGTETETSQSLVDDNTLTRIFQISEKLKTKIKDLDDKQNQASINIIEGSNEEKARAKKENDNADKAVEKQLKFALSPDNGFCQINSNDKTYSDTDNIPNKKLITLGPKINKVDSVDYSLDYSLLSEVKFTTETIKYPRFKFGDGDWKYDDDTNKYFQSFNYFYLKLKQETQAVGAGTTQQVKTNILEFANWDNIFSATTENVIEIEHAYKVEYKDKINATNTKRIGLIGITLINKGDMPPAIQIEKPDGMKIGDNTLFISVNDIDNENSDITLSIENLNEDLGTIELVERKNDKFEYNYKLTKNNKDHVMIKISVTSNGKTVTKTVKLEIPDIAPKITSLDTEYTINKYGVARLTNFAVVDPDNTEIEIIITQEPDYGDFFTIYSGGNRAFSYRNTSIPGSNNKDTFKLKAISGRSESEEKEVIININADSSGDADSSVPGGNAEFKVNFLN